MTLKSVRIELKDHLSEELREKANQLLHVLCARMRGLDSEEHQLQLINHLIHRVTFFEAGEPDSL